MEESSVKCSNNTNDNLTKRSNVITNKVIPIKKYVPMDDMCRRNAELIIDLMKNQKNQDFQGIKNDGGAEFKHNAEEFCIICICKVCLQYREIILQLMNDCIKTQNMWKVLRSTIEKFYEPIIEKTSSSTVKKVYDDLLKDDKFNWLSKGVLDNTKLQHIDFMSDLSLTDNMTFVLLSALLTVDDAIQLFELLSYQIECITRAYGEGLREKIENNSGEEKIISEDLLTYILQGYEELKKISEITSNFLFAFESKYLKHFSLSWSLINKKMYQKWVHSEFSEIMLQCIRKLKDEVDSERYQEIVREYLNFDEEMTNVVTQWQKVYVNLNEYYSLPKEAERKKRLKCVHYLLNAIKLDASTIETIRTFQDIDEWEIHPDRQLVWTSMMVYIKEKWPSVDWIRLNASNINHFCAKCGSLEEIQTIPCNCVTCLVIGESPSKYGKDIFCFKCRTHERLQTNNILKMPNFNNNELFQLKSEERDKDKKSLTTISEPYHLSWAVFKHLKDRKKYPYPTINEKYFCSNCNRTCCLLAKKILNNEMAFGLSQYLVNHYHPFSMTHNEMADMLPNIMLYNRKVISMNLTGEPPSDDIVVKTFWTFIISAFASYFVDAETDSKKPNLNNLKLNNNDIELPMEYIELNNKAIKFLDFIEKIKILLQNDSHCQVHSKSAKKDVKVIENGHDCHHVHSLKEIKKEGSSSIITEKPQAKAHPSESTAKHWEKNFSKTKHHGIQCCPDHFEELENCKENHFSKMCFHDKECSHSRVNETRDRLRKKLSQLTNAKKNANKLATDLSMNNKARADFIRNSMNKNNNKLSISTAPPVIESVIKENIAATDTAAKTNRNKIDSKKEISAKLFAQPKVSQKPVNNAAVSEKEKLGGSNNNDKNSLSSVTKSNDTNIKIIKKTDSNEIMNSEICDDQDDENLDEWIKDTLNFIEGGGKDGKKSDKVVNNKKAAKKAKQKQKKEEQKRIEELQELRVEFHELYFKEFIAKNELKMQKSLKKKDKKRITELEGNIKKVNKSKSKLETSILELISTVKALNPDFKFSYLPTKEQQQEILSKAFPEKSSTSTNSNNNNGKNGKQQQKGKKSLQQQKENDNRLSHSEPSSPTPLLKAFASSAQHQQQQFSYAMQGMMHHNFHQSQLSTTTYVSPDDQNDSTKRIVTIRRVTLPHASEPQVTVTAKGDSPDKDKLLYTFINGQLVPAGSLDSQVLNALQSPSSRMSRKQQQQQQQQQHQQPKENKNKTSTTDVQSKTKTQLKKERRRAKKLMEEQKELEASFVNNNNEQIAKLSPQPSISSDESSEILNSKSTKNKNKKIDEKHPQHQTQQKQQQQRSKSKSSNLTKVSKSEKNKAEIPNETKSSNDSKSTIKNKSNISSSSNNIKVIDNGQFDNNQFKMLHLDELVDCDDFEDNSTNIEQSMAVLKIDSKTLSNNTLNNGNKKKKGKNTEQSVQNRNDTKVTSKNHEITIKNSANVVDQKSTSNTKSNLKSTTVTSKNNQKTATTSSKLQKSNSNLSFSSTDNQKINKKATTNKTNTTKSNNCSENVAKNLHRSMQKLHLNANTTIEPAVKSNSDINNLSNCNLNISIMEQLNRGVQVEDLTLPPGITLTKVDPSRAEILRAKTESIGKLSQPMQAQPQSNHMPPPVIAPSLIPPHFGGYGSDQSGVIMVDAMNLKHRSQANNATSLNSSENKNKSKKRKNKKKKCEVTTTNEMQQKQRMNTNGSNVNRNVNNGKKSNEPKMITLRNPMFHNASAAGSNPVFPIPNKIPMAPLPVDQPAAIIKNENGMFTIRNPALHQAFLNGLQAQNIRNQYNPTFIPSSQTNDNFVGEYSYFSGNSTFPNGFYNGDNNCDENNKGKCLSAIGSEIKNAQQQKKLNNQWQTTNHQQSHSSHQSPCFNPQHTGCGGGYLNQSMGQCSPIQDNYHNQSNYYNGYDVFSSQNNIENHSNLFSHSTHSCGDDSPPPPSVTGFNRYLDGFPENENKFNDMSFLKNLVPGQRLNSEVTIHNINESKFNRNNNNVSPISHRVEITPISRPSPRSNGGVVGNRNGGLAKGNDICGNNYGENIIFNKHRINMNDNKFIDNDTTTFKQQQQQQQHYNYGFDSTSSSSSLSNDFKINLSNNDLQQCSPTIAQQQQQHQQNSSRSSPYLSNNSESTIDSFVHSMNSLKLSEDNRGCINMGNGNRWW